MEVKSVKALPGYKLKVCFDDGISGIVELSEFIEVGVFAVLKDENLFNRVYNSGYSIAWSDDLEIDSFTIYAELINRTPEDILNTDFKYAAN